MNNINPEHYKDGDKQCIDVIRELHGDCACYGGCIFNIEKYLFRQGKKEGNPPAQDIQKAMWYFDYIMNKRLFLSVDEKRWDEDFLIITKKFREVRDIE